MSRPSTASRLPSSSSSSSSTSTSLYSHSRRPVLGRLQLLSWLNNLLETDYIRLEQLCDGVAYIQLLDYNHPQRIPLHRINFSAKCQEEYIHNLRLFSAFLKRLDLKINIPIEELANGKFQAHLEMTMWMRANLPYKEKTQSIDKELNEKDDTTKSSDPNYDLKNPDSEKVKLNRLRWMNEYKPFARRLAAIQYQIIQREKKRQAEKHQQQKQQQLHHDEPQSHSRSRKSRHTSSAVRRSSSVPSSAHSDDEASSTSSSALDISFHPEDLLSQQLISDHLMPNRIDPQQISNALIMQTQMNLLEKAQQQQSSQSRSSSSSTSTTRQNSTVNNGKSIKSLSAVQKPDVCDLLRSAAQEDLSIRLQRIQQLCSRLSFLIGLRDSYSVQLLHCESVLTEFPNCPEKNELQNILMQSVHTIFQSPREIQQLKIKHTQNAIQKLEQQDATI